MFIKKIYLWFFDKRKSYYNVFKRFNIIFTLSILKKNEISLFSSLLDIVVVDLLQFENDGRFLLNHVFLNYLKQIRIIIKLFNSYGKPIYSITSLYLSSNWLEREVWDMYGVKFLFHGNLRRILLIIILKDILYVKIFH